MRLPALILVGDQDFSDRFSGRRDWRSDGYRLAPTPKTLATLFGAGHMLGGISGWDAAEASDENPARLAEVQRLTWAYLKSALTQGDDAWDTVVRDVAERGVARIDSK